MRGSILITFDETLNNRGSSFAVVTVNSQVRKIVPNDTTNQYTTFVEVGDVVNIQITPNNVFGDAVKQITVNRLDYTTDDTGGDFGIKNTLVSTVSGTTLYLNTTFTATTRPDAYNFHYVVTCDDFACYNLGSGYTGTGAPSQPAVRDVKVKNGKVYTVGNFTSYNGVAQSGLTVTDIYGNLFTGFTNLGCNTTGAQPRSVEVLDSGKVYVGALFYGGVSTNGLVRINSDGTRDTSFSGLTQNNSLLNDIEIQSDGKIIIGGPFTQINSTTRQGICRLNTDGSLDTGFGGVSGFSQNGLTAEINDLDIQSDGKILCIGYFTSYSGTAINNVCRLNTNGTLDTTFTSPFVNFNAFQTLVIEAQSDGKILIGGDLRLVSGGPSYNVLRLNTNGTLDSTFTPITGYGQCNDFEIQSDGKILISTYGGGQVTNYLFRVNSDGTTDNTFTPLPFSDNNLLTSEVIAIDEILGLFYLGGGFETVNGLPYNHFVQGFLSDGKLNMCS